MTLTWTTDLDTGIDPIDVQHRQLIDYINALDRAAEHGDRLRVAAVFEELIEYTLSHFAFEEQLQIEAGYQFATAHKAMHEVFVKRVERYKERFDAGEDVVGELQRMLKSWLVHHIKRDDKSYATQLQAKLRRVVQDRGDTGWVARGLGRFFGR